MSTRRRARTVTELASDAGEAIRTMNHLTRTRDGWAYPGDLYATLGDLARLVHALPQLLNQSAAWLETGERDGRLRTDHPAIELGASVDSARLALQAAAHAAHDLGLRVDEAHEITAHLAGTWHAEESL
jgi:hypothetical protein